MAVKLIEALWIGVFVDQEINILKKVVNSNHVVRYFHDEIFKDHRAIVLELCEMSLDDQIRQNSHGLPNRNCVALLDGLASAIEYIWRLKIVHRDIKPDNIMYLNGKYKMSDFGSAMVVPNDGYRFMTTDGTEEFAHPTLYACMNAYRLEIEPKIRNFSVHSDLWSIGVTLFEALTGFLPFKPIEGCRKNRPKMYEILSNKPRGSIACIVLDDGSLQYFSRMPKNITASNNIKDLFGPLLVKLLDVSGNFFYLFQNSNRSIVLQNSIPNFSKYSRQTNGL